VKWTDAYWLVDAEAVLLPGKYGQNLPGIVLGRDGRVNIRIIEGVECPKPSRPGQRWNGDDLLAGLDLAKILYGQKFTEDIWKVSVSNFQGRKFPLEAHLVLETRYDTEIRWGRPVSARDAFVEVPAAQKLAAIERLYQLSKRSDGNYSWLDLRFDRVGIPKPPAGLAQTTP
jgi:hypothetical protein